MPVALPIKVVIDNDAFWRPNHTVGRRLEVARERFSKWIDQASVGIKPQPTSRVERPGGLKVIKLSRSNSRNEDTPDIAPAVRSRIEVNDFRGLALSDIVVQQQPHLGGTPTEYDKLDAAIVNDRPVWQGVV
jgi:hypothetical protein